MKSRNLIALAVAGIMAGTTGCASVGLGISLPIGRAGGVGVSLGGDGQVGVGVGVGSGPVQVGAGGTVHRPKAPESAASSASAPLR